MNGKKITLTSTEVSETVEAYLNPKEIGVDKNVPWSKHPKAQGENPELEFTAADSRVMSFELLVDGYEESKNVYDSFVSKIERFVTVDDKLKRPPLVAVAWGGFPAFKGVIESMGVKYTMFLPDGTPCRATVNLKIKATDKASKAKKK